MSTWTFETPNDLLLLAYRAIHREGWEGGPTEGEVWAAVVDHLANEGLDPSTPEGEARCEYLVNPPPGHGPAHPYRDEVMRRLVALRRKMEAGPALYDELASLRALLATLPEDALGRDDSPDGGWYYRAEAIDRIDRALAAARGEVTDV